MCLEKVILKCFFADVTNYGLSWEGRTWHKHAMELISFLFFKMKPFLIDLQNYNNFIFETENMGIYFWQT